MLPKKKNLEEERAKHTVDSLYKDYVDDLFSYALGFGFDKQTAMDAIHDVFCRVCIREREVQEIQNPKFYLLRALRNQLIDTYKLKRNYSEVLTGEITDELPYKIKITVEDEIIAAEEQAEVSQKVDEILSILTERYNPQIQISAESGTKRSIFRQKNKTKRSKKRLHTTLIKPEQKVNEDLCSGFIVS